MSLLITTFLAFLLIFSCARTDSQELEGYTQAPEVTHNIVWTDPFDPSKSYLSGLIYYTEGNFEMAEFWLTWTLLLTSSDREARLLLTEIENKQKRETAVAVMSTDPTSVEDLGDVLKILGLSSIERLRVSGLIPGYSTTDSLLHGEVQRRLESLPNETRKSSFDILINWANSPQELAIRQRLGKEHASYVSGLEKAQAQELGGMVSLADMYRETISEQKRVEGQSEIEKLEKKLSKMKEKEEKANKSRQWEADRRRYSETLQDSLKDKRGFLTPEGDKMYRALMKTYDTQRPR